MDGAKGYISELSYFLLTLNYPGAFQYACLFKLEALTTMIPVACVGVHYKFGPCPEIFFRALAQFHGWAA